MTTSNLTDTTTNQVLYCQQLGTGNAAKIIQTSGNNANCLEVHSSTTDQSAIWANCDGGTGYCIVGSLSHNYHPAIYGTSSSGDSLACGVSGYTSNGVGVRGIGRCGVDGESSINNGYGIYGSGTNGANAGYFQGTVYVSGAISKPGGGYLIDHPSDPENKHLYHCFVESPEMLNIYRGVATLDNNGATNVSLPAYFDAANELAMPNLTAMGQSMPNLFAEDIIGGKFNIGGGVANGRVSWTVTAARADKWAKANAPAIEREKPAKDKGFYMHPELFGHNHTKNIDEKVRTPHVHSEPDLLSKKP